RETAAARIPKPAVVVTAQAAAFDPAVRQVRSTVRTVAVDEAIVAGAVLGQYEIFAPEPHGLDRGVVPLRRRARGPPLPPQQLADERAGSDLCERAIHLGGQQWIGSSSRGNTTARGACPRPSPCSSLRGEDSVLTP